MPEEEAEILDLDTETYSINTEGDIKIKAKGGLRKRDPKGRFRTPEITIDSGVVDFITKVSKIIKEK